MKIFLCITLLILLTACTAKDPSSETGTLENGISSEAIVISEIITPSETTSSEVASTSETIAASQSSSMEHDLSETSGSDSKTITESAYSKVRVNTSNTAKPLSRQNFGGNNFVGGYVAENNEFEFYANQNDEYKLYKRSKSDNTEIKISDNSNEGYYLCLQLYGDKIFYTHNFKSEKIIVGDGITIDRKYNLYSINFDGSEEIMLSDKNIFSYTLYNDWIYFITYDTFELFKMRTNGSNLTKLDELYKPFYMQIADEQIYLKRDETLIQMDLNAVNKNYYNLFHYEILIYDSKVYYSSYIDKNLHTVRLSGNSAKGIAGNTIEDERTLVSSVGLFNIYADKLYYVSNLSDEIYVADLDGSNPVLIGNVFL